MGLKSVLGTDAPTEPPQSVEAVLDVVAAQLADGLPAEGDGPIIPGTAGPMLLEQRGAVLTAYGP